MTIAVVASICFRISVNPDFSLSMEGCSFSRKFSLGCELHVYRGLESINDDCVFSHFTTVLGTVSQPCPPAGQAVDITQLNRRMFGYSALRQMVKTRRKYS